jgi:putative membrane protein
VSLGDRYLRVAGAVDATRLALAVLVGLAGLGYLFAGVVGVGIYLASTPVGLVPARAGARRVHLMGVLLGPLALGL